MDLNSEAIRATIKGSMTNAKGSLMILNFTKKLTAIGLLVFATVGFTSNAHAVFFEPYLGLGVGKYKNGTTDKSTLGTHLGLRVGTEFAAIAFAGLDLSIAKSKLDTSPSQDYDRTMVGAVAGVDLPLVRAWIGYNFMDNFKFDTTPSAELEGSSVKLGVGFSIFPFIKLNVEYIMYSADKYKVSGTSTNSSAEENTILVGIGIPLP